MKTPFAWAGRAGWLAPLAVLLTLVVATPALAQGSAGTISGTVLDESGQVLPGATVTVVNEATGQSRTATSNETGAFRFPVLAAGAYTVRVELTGFTTFERKKRW